MRNLVDFFEFVWTAFKGSEPLTKAIVIVGMLFIVMLVISFPNAWVFLILQIPMNFGYSYCSAWMGQK